MYYGDKPRFSSSAAALRFFFRARALLERSDRRRVRTAHWPHASTLIDDFLNVAACFDQLDAFDRWMLAELYGPTCFAASERTLSRASEAAQRLHPQGRITFAGLRRLLQQDLAILDLRLAERNLISSTRGGGNVASPGRQRRAWPRL